MRPLRVVALGGLGEFGLNMMLLEYDEAIVAVDCGSMFPGTDLLGIDLVIPDISYLLKKRKRFLGFVLTHAHEDHLGALPYVLRRIPAPVFGTQLTLGLLRAKLKEHALEEATNLRQIDPGRPWALGPFTLEGIRVTHSLVDCLALAITSPAGIVIHTGDFKIDNTPMPGEMFDFQRFAAYGEKGVLLLLSDSTNVEREGHTPSEREVGRYLEGIFHRSNGRVFIATFASNIPRIQQILDLCRHFGRRVVLTGRSMVNNTQIAAELGYLRLQEEILKETDRWQDVPPEQLAFLTTGSQGEPLSVLHRVALNEHRSIKVGDGDTVVLSSKFIPGNEKAITNVINHLYRRGAEVHYEKVSEVHVSGHASQEELRTMLHLTKPRYFVPIHGEYRHFVRHIRLARSVGIPEDNCFLLGDGEVLEVNGEGARITESIASGKVFVDGQGIGDVEDIVIRDRRHLSEDGMVLAIMAIHQQTGELVSGPDLVSRGFMRPEEGEEVLDHAKKVVLETLRGMNREARADPLELQEEVRKALRRYFKKALRRHPVVLPFVMET